jgi:hypothetical protein
VSEREGRKGRLKDWRKVEERKTKRGKKDDLSILN